MLSFFSSSFSSLSMKPFRVLLSPLQRHHRVPIFHSTPFYSVRHSLTISCLTRAPTIITPVTNTTCCHHHHYDDGGNHAMPLNTLYPLPASFPSSSRAQRKRCTDECVVMTGGSGTQVRRFHSSAVLLSPSDVSEALAKDLAKIISHDRIVLFLTGTPEAPRCRFTVQLLELMHQLDVPFGYFNILEDDEVCEGLKQYSDWPTYPQVYIDGELLGGFDVMKEMLRSGALKTMLKEKDLLK